MHYKLKRKLQGMYNIEMLVYYMSNNDAYKWIGNSKWETQVYGISIGLNRKSNIGSILCKTITKMI